MPLPTEANPVDGPELPPAEWLERALRHTQDSRNAMRQAELRWSWGRLGVFVAFAWQLIRPLSDGIPQVVLLGATALAFALAIRVHVKWRRGREGADRLLLVLGESQQRAGGQVVLVRSNERPAPMPNLESLRQILSHAPAWELTPQERDDLDLYSGPIGVFGLLNRASTPLGETRLRNSLEHPILDVNLLRSRQVSVSRLAERAAARFRCMAAAACLRKQELSLITLTVAVREAAALGIPMRSLLLRIAAPINLIIFVVGIARGMSGSSAWGIASLMSVVIGGALFQLVRRQTSAALHPWERTAEAAQGLLHVARESHEALGECCDAVELQPLAAIFSSVLQRTALPRLCGRLPWNDSGGPMRMALNALVFHDLILAESIVRCAVSHRAKLLDALSALGELEALCSLAAFAWEQPHKCWPSFEARDGAATGMLHIEQGFHPLIPPGVAVANSMMLGHAERVWLLTGSNMAGKSTFLRMVGLNTVLAQVGATCAATKANLMPVRLMTDLRARDDLSRGESYFLAEVRQLRRMLPEYTEGDAAVLGLIDEPLRGTNSAERVAASVAVVEHLIDGRGLFVIASHEQRLTELADGRRATNHHFRENLSSAGPTFDYVLRDGPATTRNALRVMRREGYPDSLMRRAESLAAGADGPSGLQTVDGPDTVRAAS